MNAHEHGRSRSRERGFTLLEVLVVVGIVALGLVLAAPSLSRARPGLMVRSAALELAADLRSVRAIAREANVEQVFTIDLSHRQYWADGVVGSRRLPRSIAVDLTVPDSERVGASVGRIRFFPDGSTSGARVLLHDGRSTASVLIDWLTGDVRLQVK